MVRALLAELAAGIETGPALRAGVRLLGVGVSGLADWVQDDLFADLEPDEEPEDEDLPEPPGARSSGWAPGADVEHDLHGRGWVWGSGRGVVTVRFETRGAPAGPVRSFPVDDPALHPWRPAEPDEVEHRAGDATGDDEAFSGPG